MKQRDVYTENISINKLNKTILKVISLFILGIFIFLSANYVSAATNIAACQTIAASGQYILNQSITNTGTCIIVSASNVELDCNGYIITYGTNNANTNIGIDAINGANARTNLTVKNCVISKQSNAGTNGYGIRLTRYSNSILLNNSIYTNGTSNNYGIYLTTNSQNNSISNNVVYAKGSAGTNIGIYIVTNCYNNIIRNNTILTSGTTLDYGIYLSGLTTPSNNNSIINNTIRANGSGVSNHGVYLLTNSNFNNVSGNDIIANGTTTKIGRAHV